VRFPPVHRAVLEGQLRAELISSLNLPAMTAPPKPLRKLRRGCQRSSEFYNQDKLNFWSAFHPGADRDNIEILADKFALETFDQIKIFNGSDDSVDQVIMGYLSLGTFAELSYLLRRAHTYGIVELFLSGVDLPLTYHLTDVHPPLEYRFLLMSMTLIDRLNSSATNPFLKILNNVK